LLLYKVRNNVLIYYFFPGICTVCPLRTSSRSWNWSRP